MQDMYKLQWGSRTTPTVFLKMRLLLLIRTEAVQEILSSVIWSALRVCDVRLSWPDVPLNPPCGQSEITMIVDSRH